MIGHMDDSHSARKNFDNSHLLGVAYEELRRIARATRAAQPRAFNTTTLVHEVYLKLREYSGVDSLEHLKSIAARAMRQIMVDHLRHRQAQKRSSEHVDMTLAEFEASADSAGFDLLVVDQAMSHIEKIDQRLASIVDMVVFAGMTMAEIASAVGLTERTVFRDWRKARAILSNYFELAVE
jgi:RNA polymerase sigma factor (TIGR02999 family)